MVVEARFNGSISGEIARLREQSFVASRNMLLCFCPHSRQMFRSQQTALCCWRACVCSSHVGPKGKSAVRIASSYESENRPRRESETCSAANRRPPRYAWSELFACIGKVRERMMPLIFRNHFPWGTRTFPASAGRLCGVSVVHGILRTR